MAPSGSAVLAEVLSQPTARGDFGDWRFVPGFKANRKPVLGLEAPPIADGIPGSRRHWFVQLIR
ncbi:hypothetical protein EGT51_07875 [Levilactobacillus suantsaiihabitans]|uniref:Uncharacterized protein n=1 Tax=Levilactobacillus suantsaiihabitans TaxID=2487722 RepID=A0A4Z0JAD6_9LACO|nr:hypothetical protein EGT51_07875 [Levilactobacillus suantsaiihabitans]